MKEEYQPNKEEIKDGKVEKEKKTIAQSLEDKYEEIPRMCDEDESCRNEKYAGHHTMSPAEFLEKLGHSYKIINKDEVADSKSHDPSWLVEFEDGSRADIGNPHQAAFTGEIRDIESYKDKK